ncbi:MAG: manganese efflux pump MntP family protein [Desulfobulbus sp.]|nr:manganese efflux pump MntP family protein [Desulfobulbus sp.]
MVQKAIFFFNTLFSRPDISASAASMDAASLVAVALALSMDAFAVSLAAGATLHPLTFRPCFRLAFHFGLFQAIMPIMGWLAGITVQPLVAAWSHWVAFLLLASIGGRMMYTALNGEKKGAQTVDPSRGLTMVALAVATSIDALAVGLTLAMLKVAIWIPALVIGLVTSGCAVAGLFLGARAGQRWGRWVEVAGGAILIGIGLKILLTALFFEQATAGVGMNLPLQRLISPERLSDCPHPAPDSHKEAWTDLSRKLPLVMVAMR